MVAAPEPAQDETELMHLHPGDGGERRATLSDVIRGYRLFLGRDVESVSVAAHHLALGGDLWDLVERLWGSPEARRHRLGEALAESSLAQAPAADVSATPEELQALLAVFEADVERRGRGARHQWLERDRPRYDQRSARWNSAAALAEGAQEGRALRRLCAELGAPLDPAAAVAALVEDCFSLAEAFAEGSYLGVALTEAEAKAARAILRDRELVRGDAVSLAEFRRGGGRYDLFYSTMTLQYAPPPVALSLLESALQQVRPGGLACFQLACAVHDYAFAASPYLRGEGRDLVGELHAVPRHEVLALLDRSGFAPLDVRPDGRLGGLGVSYSFMARRRS